jgi:hypothetical protein
MVDDVAEITAGTPQRQFFRGVTLYSNNSIDLSVL